MASPGVLRELDELLFEPRGWFVIDAGNNRVAGIPPRSLQSALALVGHGRVATVVGRLRPEITGIDIDVKGYAGADIAQQLAAWSKAHGLWHLVRPSGRAPGHAHVLILAGVHKNELLNLVDQLRQERGLSGKTLDLRRQFRPLSAPHRQSGRVPGLPGAQEALTELRHVLALLPARDTHSQASTPTQAAATVRARRVAEGALPAVPLPRRRREIPAPWAAYLTHGRTAAAAVDTERQDRSLIEAKATKQLVLAGLEEHQAWEAIAGSPATAFPKAKAAGRLWWRRFVWNRAVADDTAWRMEHLPTQARDTVEDSGDAQTQHARQAIAHARTLVETTWRSWPRATRYVDRDVALTILERLHRVGRVELMIPQRDLLQDCAVTTRRTAVAAFRRCVAAGLFQEITDTYLPGTSDTSHTIRLPLPENTTPSNQGHALLLSDPPRSSRTQWEPAPYRLLPIHLRRALRLPTLGTLASYLPSPADPGLTLEAAAHHAGYLEHPEDELTPGQRRTLLGHLTYLEEHGLAAVDAQGQWNALDPQPATELVDRGRRAHLEIQSQVATERHDHRDFLDPARRKIRWNAQESAAIARSRKADIARQRAYVQALPPETHHALQERGRRRYEEMSVVERAAFLNEQAARRTLEGRTEQEFHDDWVAAQHPDHLERRALERAAQFSLLPPPQRRAHVMMWQNHRTTWSVQQTSRQTLPTTDLEPLPHNRDGADPALFNLHQP